MWAAGAELPAVLVTAAAAPVHPAAIRIRSHHNLLKSDIVLEVMVGVLGCDHVATTARVAAGQRCGRCG